MGRSTKEGPREAEVKVGAGRGVAAGGVSKAVSCSKLSNIRLILSASKGILQALNVQLLDMKA